VNRRKFNATKKPEEKIRDDFIDFLKIRDWFVKIMHGSAYQSGVPDLYCAHLKYGQRWVEVKNPLKYEFTAAQRETFPKMSAHGVGIWVVTAATEEEYKKLFQQPNWYFYLMVKL